MRILLAVAMMVGLVQGCKTCEPKEAEKLVVVHQSILKQTFDDGTKVDSQGVEKDADGKLYYMRKGTTQGKDCRVSRTEVSSEDGMLLMRMQGTTETCSGKSCSHCAFKTGGGCECKNSLNTCEHTISRNRDLLLMR